MSEKLKLVGALLLAFAVSAAAGPVATVLGGLVYKFPSADGTTGQVLLNDGAGILSWVTASPGGSAVMPSGLIVFSTATCASLGYSDYSAANGRYPVGATSGLGGTVGTALSSLENRATGDHTHSASGSVSISNGSHTHSITDSGHTHDWDTQAASYGHQPEEIMYGTPPDEWYDWDYPQPWYKGRATASRNSSTSGVGYSVGNTSISASGSVDSFTINNGGTGTGTNAPYRQLRMCQK